MSRKKKPWESEEQEAMLAFLVESAWLQAGLDGRYSLDQEGRYAIPARDDLAFWRTLREEVQAGIKAEGLPPLAVEVIDRLVWEFGEQLQPQLQPRAQSADWPWGPFRLRHGEGAGRSTGGAPGGIRTL